jgi:hypothetical protein
MEAHAIHVQTKRCFFAPQVPLTLATWIVLPDYMLFCLKFGLRSAICESSIEAAARVAIEFRAFLEG